MQSRTIRATLAGLALLLTVGQRAWADPIPVTISVDEHGNSLFDSPILGTATSPGVLAADPGPGGLAAALTYNLLGPPSLVLGDVLLIEPGSGNISDVLRFNPANSATGYPASLVFYSDNSDGIDALADTGLPTNFYTNLVRIPEVGPEGLNGAIYTPTANQPGFIDGYAVTYRFVSDGAIPEPGSLVLMGIGGAGLLATMARRRRSAARA